MRANVQVTGSTLHMLSYIIDERISVFPWACTGKGHLEVPSDFSRNLSFLFYYF